MKISRRQLLTGTAATALISGLPAHASNAGTQVEQGFAFGSTWRLVLPKTAEAPLARDRVEAILGQVDLLMSPFRSDSDVGRFNRNGGTGTQFDSKTCVVLESALEVARASGGGFDPTATPFARRFGFGSPHIAAGRPAGHFSELQFTGHTLQSKRPGLSLDLCGAAKGYALDQIVSALEGLDFLIEIGGEVAARGRHPTGRAWRFGIEHPEGRGLHTILEADNRALATSGNTHQSFSYDGKRYGHVVDPRTGLPVENTVATVSVRAPNGLLADSLATAALVLGPEETHRLLHTFDAGALFLLYHPDGLQPLEAGRFTL